MAGTAERLVLLSEERARASEPTQESIARLLEVYDQASAMSRRHLYERALFLQYGLLLQVVREHPDVLEEIQAAQPPAGVIAGDRASMPGAAGTST